MSATRTDAHRPSAAEFDPTDYQLHGVYYLGASANTMTMMGAESDRARHREALARLQAQGMTSAGVYGSRQCSHCGARLSYAALMVHTPTRTWLHIGEDCLDNRFELDSKAEFQLLRKQIAAKRKAGRKAEDLAALVAAHPLLVELTYNQPGTATSGNDFLSDVAGRFIHSGELSEAQIAAVESSLRRGMEWQAQRDVERAARKPAPAGRVTVRGTVTSTKWVESDYGMAEKMGVLSDDGYQVWLTVPASLKIHDLARGMRVQFDAKLQPKNDDPTFAYGGRPTKGQLI